jgi:hypothetical protein
MFVSKVADAASAACIPDYELLRPVLLELKRRYPEPPPARLRPVLLALKRRYPEA